MKLISIILLVIFGCISNTQTALQNKINAHLEISTINNQKHGKLISVNMCLKNDLNKSYFFDGLNPLSLRVLQEVESSNYKDITEDWKYEEMFYLEKDSLYKVFPEDRSTELIFDPLKKEFINPYVANFYSDQLIRYQSKIRTSNDKENIKKWVRHKFEGIMYLESGEMHCKAFSINSLKPGRYKVFFTYSDKEIVNLDDSSGFIKSLDLQLPVEIRGFEKWHGEISSDTLYYNIK